MSPSVIGVPNLLIMRFPQLSGRLRPNLAHMFPTLLKGQVSAISYVLVCLECFAVYSGGSISNDHPFRCEYCVHR